jgi:hypothetical protein
VAKLSSPRKVDKAMNETARASGISPEDAPAAVQAFLKVLVAAGFDEAQFAALNHDELLAAARSYFASHPSASASQDPAAKASLAPREGSRGPKNAPWLR